MPAHTGKTSWLEPFAGLIAALAIAECGLRLVATGATAEGIPRNETYRQYGEGTATSHFLADGSRATGNDILPGAPTVLVLGDSHVQAVQVEDTETMGSVLERLARARGIPLNVKQIGWSGAGYGVARTLALGPGLVDSNGPQRIAVVLSEGAIRTYPSDAADALHLRSEPPPALRNLDTLQRIAREVAHHSVLLHLIYARLREMRAPRGDTDSSADLGSNCVRETGDERTRIVGQLHAAFGDDLFIMYAPYVGLDSSELPDCWEAMLMRQCAEEELQCMSMREGMLQARKQNVLTRGFHNTPLGVGHLNPQGHRIAAEVLFTGLVLPMTESQR